MQSTKSQLDVKENSVKNNSGSLYPHRLNLSASPIHLQADLLKPLLATMYHQKTKLRSRILNPAPSTDYAFLQRLSHAGYAIARQRIRGRPSKPFVKSTSTYAPEDTVQSWTHRERRTTSVILSLGLHFADRNYIAARHNCLSTPLFHREELRRRFVKAETMLFRIRFDEDISEDRESFLKSHKLGWELVCYFHRIRMLSNV